MGPKTEQQQSNRGFSMLGGPCKPAEFIAASNFCEGMLNQVHARVNIVFDSASEALDLCSRVATSHRASQRPFEGGSAPKLLKEIQWEETSDLHLEFELGPPTYSSASGSHLL